MEAVRPVEVEVEQEEEVQQIKIEGPPPLPLDEEFANLLSQGNVRETFKMNPNYKKQLDELEEMMNVASSFKYKFEDDVMNDDIKVDVEEEDNQFEVAPPKLLTIEEIQRMRAEYQADYPSLKSNVAFENLAEQVKAQPSSIQELISRAKDELQVLASINQDIDYRYSEISEAPQEASEENMIDYEFEAIVREKERASIRKSVFARAKQIQHQIQKGKALLEEIVEEKPK